MGREFLPDLGTGESFKDLVSSSAVRQGNHKNGIAIGKEKVKLLYLKKHIIYSKKILKNLQINTRISEFSKFAVYKINVQN